MWPFNTYPECSPEDVDGKAYDYIIVGGGAAGCVLASRLSENPNVSVLLIERGHVKDNLVSRMPLLSQNIWWTDTLQVQNTIRSEPIIGANGRVNRLWAVNGIGGGSRINAMLWTRGTPGMYAMWSDMGLTDWAWDKVEPYFKRLENVTWPLDKLQAEARGRGGPVELRKPPYAFKWLKYIEKASRNIGFSTFDDCNDPEVPSCGYFTLDTAIDRHGQRVSALSAFLSKSVAQERLKSLSVCTGTVASRLEVSGDEQNKRTVTGVHIRSSTGSSKQYFVKARKEVILTCGAMTTPQLLLLSGIGPSKENSNESNLGIPLVKELPAVGANFSDHYAFPVMLEIPRNETFHYLESALWALWTILLWFFTGKGWASLGATPSAIFLHTDSIDEKTMQVTIPQTQEKLQNHDIPNVEVMIMPINSLELAPPGRSLFSLFPVILQPEAKGRLEITSTDPLANPKITHPMLGHDDDVKVARRAVRLCMRLASEFQSLYPSPAPIAFAPGNELHALREWENQDRIPEPSSPDQQHVTTESPPPPSENNKTWENVTDAEIDDYMRRVGHTALHFSSTCPMGTDEKNGVVDQRLVVFGFENLRIADASVFPRVPPAHTMAPVMMVAERCADFVMGKGGWGEEDD